MKKIKIITDSTLDMSEEDILKYGVKVVPLSISIDEETFLDRIDISPQEFIKKMKASNELPKTSQPSPGAFAEVYDEIHKEGFQVLSIHASSGLSGTINAAYTASEMTEADVTIIDSKFISKALSFQVEEACEMAAENKCMAEIVTKLEQIQKNTHLFVVVHTLENLIKGGRIGKGRGLIGTLLKIKPIAVLEDGVYAPVTKVRSSSQVIRFLSEQFASDTAGRTVKKAGIAHADGKDLALKTSEAIRKTAPGLTIPIEDTTPVISTHTGPGAIAFMYELEE
ncbi:DegV family protein [Sinobaca sp. H24]|uniref:DegV family protein n=1 Tax=Sinobaca sp. H24 TaxID=2923376 RepID=UPI00207924D3|nr:DegV family protein [Sinobaca sp. H24]